MIIVWSLLSEQSEAESTKGTAIFFDQIFSSYTSNDYLDMEVIMTAREAIRILMLSPIYFKIPPNNRIKLIKDYCLLYVSEPKKKK